MVPADKKWFRNLCVAQILCDTLSTHRAVWKEQLERLSQEKTKELAQYRSETRGLDIR